MEIRNIMIHSEQNLNLNNTCIRFEEGNQPMQAAIINFYNDNGWDVASMDKEEGDNVIGVLNGQLGYWNLIKKFTILELPKDYYSSESGITNVSDKHSIDSNDVFFQDLLLLISIDVQNELLLQCKRAKLDDCQTDLINDNIIATFELNKQNYLNLINEKLNK